MFLKSSLFLVNGSDDSKFVNDYRIDFFCLELWRGKRAVKEVIYSNILFENVIKHAPPPRHLWSYFDLRRI